MNFFLKNWIRLSYFSASLVFVLLAYKYDSFILSVNATALDKFSYAGTIATIIGLVIAIAEILHSIKVSREAKDETAKLLAKIRNFDYATFTSECQQYLDDVNYHVNVESYLIALKSFQHFRTTYSRFAFDIKARETINAILGVTEAALHAGVQSSPASPLTKKQRRSITDNLLKIKEILQQEIAEKNEENVSAENY